MSDAERPGDPEEDQAFASSVDALFALAQDKQRIAIFTGAGISTESGIPDYRGPGGVWATQKPPTLGDFLTNPETRRTYWLSRKERFPELLARQPNAGHLAIASLFDAGLVHVVITQHIDGLHQDAGVPAEHVFELHGSARTVQCVQCGRTWSGEAIQARQETGELVPDCEVCGGVLRTSTVLFGEPLPDGVFSRSLEAVRSSDLMMVVGSSLVVQPAARIPLVAVRAGIPLAIVNLESTPLDDLASVVARQPAGATLSALTDRLLGSS